MLPSKKAIHYCPTKYHNISSGKFIHILNDNINNANNCFLLLYILRISLDMYCIPFCRILLLN